MHQKESIKEFDGFLNRYIHTSEVCHCDMTFSVYLPPQATTQKVPAVYWLSGLTCTDENARTKAGAQRYAAELGLALIFPDTSPRGSDVPGSEPEIYSLGKGAGFYVNATEPKWQKHYQMYSYITEELPSLLETHLPILPGIRSITGHSMGGHGALICALKAPSKFVSVSAFAPICNPMNAPWGETCFATYLGLNKLKWEDYDATCLVKNNHKCKNILIDQGLDDEFYLNGQLLPENLKAACIAAKQPLELRYHPGYDHSYHFISTFIGEHLKYHASHLFSFKR